MLDLTSYSASDFIPFTQEVYLRLLERVNESYWPLHILALVTALIVLLAAWRRHRYTLKLLALIWLGVGVGFLFRFYEELNWAGRWFGVAYIAQAFLLLLVGLRADRVIHPLQRDSGLLLAFVGLLWPAQFPLGRIHWTQLESIGIHADPSVVFSLGILLLLCTGWRLWLLYVIPLLWCGLSIATLQVLGLPQHWVLAGTFTLASLTLITTTLWESRITKAAARRVASSTEK